MSNKKLFEKIFDIDKLIEEELSNCCYCDRLYDCDNNYDEKEVYECVKRKVLLKYGINE